MTTLLDSPSDGSFSTPGMAIVFSFTPWWASLPSFYVSSDAAGAQGYRAIFDHEWFVDKWPPAQQPLSIPCKELFLVVVVVHLKCSQWVSKQVEFCSDIMTVVSVLPLSSSKNPNMMILLHHLSVVDVHHSFTFNTSQCGLWQLCCWHFISSWVSTLLQPSTICSTWNNTSSFNSVGPTSQKNNVNFTLQTPCFFHASSLQLCSASILRILLPG